MSRNALDLLQQRRNRAINTVHTWLLGAGSLLLFAATAWTLAGETGVIYAIVLGMVTMLLARRASPQMVLRMYKAQPVGRNQFPAGIEMVEALSRRAGLPVPPQLHVIPSKVMNAFAVGRRNDSAIAITDALARQLNGRELAGVLAHEISHIAHEDLKVIAFADMVSRFTSLWSTFGTFAAFFNLFAVASGVPAFVPWPAVLLLVLAPTIGGLLQMALSRTREFDADLGAVMLTRDPDGLASALMKLERAQGVHWERLLPGNRQPAPSVLRSHPNTEARVARLMALKNELAYESDFTDPARPRRRPSMVPAIRRPSGAQSIPPRGQITWKRRVPRIGW